MFTFEYAAGACGEKGMFLFPPSSGPRLTQFVVNSSTIFSMAISPADFQTTPSQSTHLPIESEISSALRFLPSPWFSPSHCVQPKSRTYW